MSKELEKLPESTSETGSRSEYEEAPPLHPVLQLQRLAGNRAVTHLLRSDQGDGVPGQVLTLAPSFGGVVQRKCKQCSATAKCAACEEEEIQRKNSVSSLTFAPTLQRKKKTVQRAANDGGAASPAGIETASTEPTANAAGPLIVADEASNVGPNQMRKSEFLEQLRSTVCSTADAALAEAGQSTAGCPYIEQWLSYYADQEPGHIERALRKYAPEANGATSAAEYIPAVSNRVREGVQRWVRTGELSGVPPELAGMLPGGGGMLGALAGIGSAIGGAISAVGSAIGSAFSSIGRALFKTKGDSAPAANEPWEIQEKLTEGGEPLDNSVSGKMSEAFGHDFSNVRVHTNAQAVGLSDDLNARAFTIGSDIAFAAGEYRPGTLVGDALIAHELAHVVQQRTASATVSSKDEQTQSGALEGEADVAAVTAVASIWSGTRYGLTSVAAHALPRLKSGLKLRSCGPEPTPKNRYEELVVEGTKKLQDPPFKFGLPWQGIKCGQDQEPQGKKPFDEEFWTSEVAGEKQCMLVNKGLPSDAIDALFNPARRDRWQIDCTIFTQLPHLYALLKTYGPAKFNERFNNRIELRKEFSTGMKTRSYWVEGSRRGWLAEAVLAESGQGPITEAVAGSDLTSAKINPDTPERPVDDVLKDAPVGSRVTFATYAIPTHFSAVKPVMDNTVKMGDNYYAAHDVPAGKDGMYTKEEIQELLAQKYSRPEQNVQVVLVEIRALP